MNEQIDYISYLSIYIPAIAGIFSFKSVSSLLRLIIVYVWVTASLEIIVDLLKWEGINNLFLFHIHTFIEFGFITVLYGNLLRTKGKNKVLNAVAFIFLLSSVLLLLFYQNFSEFNSVQRHIEGFLITFIIAFYLFERSNQVKRMSNTPLNVLSWGLLLYFGGNLFVFAFGDKILTSGNGELWAIHGILNIILNLIFAYVILKSKPSKKPN